MVATVVETDKAPQSLPRGSNARGNAAQRRADVLASAEEILDETGWAGLSIRGVASRSGVSPGAVYQWFSGKDEIFAELYSARLHETVNLIYRQPDEIGLRELTANLFSHIAVVWARLGRYELDVTALSDTSSLNGASSSLSNSFDQLTELVMARLVQAAKVDGYELERSSNLATMFWATAHGVAQRIVAMRFDSQQADEFVTYAAASFVRGVVSSD